MTDSSQPNLVSVIVPARDEANSIGSLLLNIKESLSGYPHEITVVDDGSIDGTGEIASRGGAKVVSCLKSLGKGAAMKSGVEISRGDILVFIDGDGAHSPEDIPRVIVPIINGEADLVIGSRALPESTVSVSPFSRKLGNKLASFVISVIVSFLLPLVTMFKLPVKYVKITDCTSGFRAITRENWRKLALISNGFQVESEMIYEVVRSRLTIIEVPISCNWDSQLSRLSILRDGLETLKLLSRKLVASIGGR